MMSGANRMAEVNGKYAIFVQSKNFHSQTRKKLENSASTKRSSSKNLLNITTKFWQRS
jgi:hypothetical protein